ncbi:hypothetical protein [Alkaliphilus hydrothermalis]|uniref:Uncharacterized protein n=1 Tax=Alkaliphilus hydrothermalis TaxID=1482730 RepID=A0ABS2NPH0_9FIRM|nr:hypothetical protein [Alkaliphilus hydrothermalis]MBM7614843.1 hypothetical protein [Alkaliphilus hydrothermalis]
MDQRKINELLSAAKKGDYSKLEEIKGYVSDEEYQMALQLFQQYAGKSQAEIIKELAKLKKTVPNQQEIIDKIQPFLNDEQKSKLKHLLDILDEE